MSTSGLPLDRAAEVARDRRPLAGRTRLLLALAALAPFLAARLPAMDRSLWLDEVCSLEYARLGPAYVAADDFHPPLYYVLLDGWVAVGGTSETWVRSLSLLAGALHVVLLGVLAAALAGERAGWAAALLAAASARLAWPAFEARNYVFANLLATGAWLAVAYGLRSTRWTAWWVAGVLVALSLWTFYFAGLAAAGVAVFVLVSRPGWRRGRRALVGLAVALLLFAPWVPSLFTQLGRAERRFGHSGGAGGLLGVGEDLFVDSLPTPAAVFAIFAGLASVLVAWAHRVQPPAGGEERRLVPRALPATVALIVAFFLASFATQAVVPLFSSRYTTFLAGAWIVLLALMTPWLSTRVAPVRRVGLVLFVLLVGTSAALATRRAARWRTEDWRAGAAAVRAHAGAGDLVLVVPVSQARSMRHYLPEPAGTYGLFADPERGLLPAEVAWPERAHEVPLDALLARAAARVFVAEDHRAQRLAELGGPRLHARLQEAGWVVADVASFERVRVTRYERAGLDGRSPR